MPHFNAFPVPSINLITWRCPVNADGCVLLAQVNPIHSLDLSFLVCARLIDFKPLYCVKSLLS